MKKARVFVPLLTIIIIGVIAKPDRYPTARQDHGEELGFPFEIVSEEPGCCFGPPTWQAFIEIPKAYYSKENLDRLFRFFSLRHPNMQERLYVKVYAGKLTPGWELRKDPISVPWIPMDRNEPHQEPDVVRWDATFDRAGDGFGLPGRNEYYSYRPDLVNDAENLVILKGTLIHRPKKIVETWKTSNGNIKVRVLAYYLEGVDPAGVYYTFQSYDPNWSEWQPIMTFRQDQSIRIPADSVVFLTNTTAYVMMGSMYAATTDSGANWSVWDAERDFEMGRWCEHWLIGHVEIAANGNGTMKLSPSAQLSETSLLHTSDFGRNWNSE